MRFVRNTAVEICLAASFAVSCGGVSGEGASGEPVEVVDREGPSFYEDAEPAPNAGSNNEGLPVLDSLLSPDDSGPVSADNIQQADACVITQAEATLVREAVDIILLLDNSGSMADELEAAEQNINLNFASVLATSEVDYRVILISRHRREPRQDSGESSTSVCVSSPLSTQDDCRNASDPAFGERFFHYSTKVESDDSLDILLDTFEPPFDDDHEDRGNNAPEGWSEWLRPGAKKVFLEMTDDNEDMSASDFLESLTQMAPEHFGPDPATLPFVFHSIVGLAEKSDPSAAYQSDEPLQTALCDGGGNNVDNAGEVYQQLSILTNGLRFPLCQFDAYDVVFQQIAQDVVFQTSLACDFPVPSAPEGATLDLDKVAVEFTLPGQATPQRLGQARDFASCAADTFLISDGRLTLCPEACQIIREKPEAKMDVLFTCESQLPPLR